MSKVVIPHIHPVAVITVFNSREMSEVKTVEKCSPVNSTQYSRMRP